MEGRLPRSNRRIFLCLGAARAFNTECFRSVLWYWTLYFHGAGGVVKNARVLRSHDTQSLYDECMHNVILSAIFPATVRWLPCINHAYAHTDDQHYHHIHKSSDLPPPSIYDVINKTLLVILTNNLFQFNTKMLAIGLKERKKAE